MVYFISDLHANIDFEGLNEYLQKCSDDDLLILLGDTFLYLEETENKSGEFTEKFLAIEKNIAIVDGNHENFEYLDNLPKEEWNGGVVGRLTKNIVHLRRGNVYTIDGEKYFAFGGCAVTSDDIHNAHKNLKFHNYNVDYILTHKYENNLFSDDRSNELKIQFSEFIDQNVNFKKWFSGHWHKNVEIDEKHIIVYDKLIAVS